MMMEAIFHCVAGLDVHAGTVAACVRRVDQHGNVPKEVRTFETTTRNLVAPMDWLVADGVTHVARGNLHDPGVYI